MVNLVIVSHSARLGEGVGELARQMLMNDGCKLAIAAGIDDPASPIGTDPIKVMEAIESVADADHILVMMDIGSALLSAETALDLLDPAIAAKVRLCAAPLVEGTLAATVSAAAGAKTRTAGVTIATATRFADRRAGRRPRRALGFRGDSKPQRTARSPGVKAGRRAGGIQCRPGAGERG